jgi:hypothetical protein
MVPAKCKYVDSESTAYLYEYTWYSIENKEIPDRNIGVPPVRKYANYRTLSNFGYRDTANFRPSNGLIIIANYFYPYTTYLVSNTYNLLVD